MSWLWEVLSWLGVFVIGFPVVYLLMKATDYRKRHDKDI